MPFLRTGRISDAPSGQLTLTDALPDASLLALLHLCLPVTLLHAMLPLCRSACVYSQPAPEPLQHEQISLVCKLLKILGRIYDGRLR
jgi:hypothetical protein